MKGQLKAVIVRWLLVPWECLREPKVQHAMLASAYLAVVIGGVGAVSDGHWPAGVLLILGGALPLFSLHGGHWGLERSGLLFLIGGFIAYAAGIVPGQAETVGELVTRSAIIGSIVAAMCARWWHIRGLDMDPDR